MIIILLFAFMFLLMTLGLPIALAIGLPAIGLIVSPGVFPDTVTLAALGQTVVQQLFSGVDSFDLLAVPLFMIAGSIMEVGGISRRLIDFCNSLVGWAPGGLAAAAIVASMIIAGISGSAAADTAAIGAVVIPAMIRQGYPAPFAAAVVAAGGSIGIIIPPSIPMVLFGFMTNISISQLFAGGMLVGVLLGLSFMVIAVFIAWRNGYGEREPFSMAKVVSTGRDAVWSMGAPVVVLGGILSGVVTVTEAAALAVFYALLVGTVINKELPWKELPALIVRSQISAGGILFIIAMAKIFGWLLAMQQSAQLLDTFVNSLSLPPVGLLLLIMALLLVVGCVMETTAALLLLVPVLAVLTPQMQVDPVQFGVLVVVNLAIGMLTPPVGICLFVSCSIANISLGKISKAVMPLVAVAMIDLLIAALWPPLTMWLPTLFYRS
jgi:tripartite ATP-independent transporter DctM subunit